MKKEKPIPATETPDVTLPGTEVAEKKLPDAQQSIRVLPNIGNPENSITIGGK